MGTTAMPSLVPRWFQVFGSDVDETGDDLVESVLGDSPGAMGEAVCPPNFVAEAVIDREVVR